MSYIYRVFISEYQDQEDFWQQIGLYYEHFRDASLFCIYLELEVKPKIFEHLEELGLKVDYGRDVDLSVHTISSMGITLLADYFPPGQDEATGYVFVPMDKIVSINTLGDANDWARIDRDS